MSIAQASTTATPRRAVAARSGAARRDAPAALRREGDDDLWATLDQKLAERERRHKLSVQDQPSRSGGWLAKIVRGMGFGAR